MSGYDLGAVLRGQLQGQAAPAENQDIETITGEIIHLKQDLARNIIDIGRRLLEAKAVLPHGEWLPWLAERVCFSEKSAQNYMRVAREFPNPQLVADLGVRKALALLELPPAERAGFVEENDVIDMTSRELEKAIRERDEARRAAEAAQSGAQTAEEARAKMEADMQALKAIHRSAQENEAQARAELVKIQAELKALRDKPVDVAVETVADMEAVKKAREEAIAEMQFRVDKAEASRKAAEEKWKSAEEALEKAKREAGNRAIGSNADLAAFDILFGQVQEQTNKMRGLLLKVRSRDEEAAGKLEKAILSLADVIRRCAE